MKQTSKNISRAVACLLAVGLAVPYTFPTMPKVQNSTVFAASAAEEFISSAADITRCTLYTSSEDSFNMNGRTYYQGIVFGDGSYKDNAELSFNVENISTLKFSLGHVDNTNSSSAEFSIYLDGVLEDKFTLSQNEMITDYTLDVSKASTLRIFRTGDYSQYAIADISVDESAPAKTFTVPKYETSAAFLGSMYDSYRVKTYDGSNKEVSFNMNGRSYYQGLVMGDGSYKDNASASFNVENVNTISFSLGHIDNSNSSSAEFSIYLDNVLEDKFTLSQNEMIADYTLDVSKASTLRIFRNGDYSQYALADITVDEMPPKTTYTVPEYKSSASFLSSIYDSYRTEIYDGSSTAVSFNMNGRSYYQGLVMGDGSYEDNASFSINVENLKTISFTLGHVDNTNSSSAEFSIYLDNNLEDKFTLSQNEPLKDYSIDVSKVSVLRIFRSGDYSRYGLADIKADELTAKNTYSIPEYKNSSLFVNSIYDNYRTAVYDGISSAVSFNMNGRKYYQGVIMGDGSYEDNAAFSLNVEKIKSLSFDLGHVDGSSTNPAEFSIYLDGELVDTLKLAGNELISTYTIDVSKASTFRIFRDGDYSKYALADIKADELVPKNLHTVPSYESSEKFVDSAYDNIRTEIFNGSNKFNLFKMNGKEYIQGIILGNSSYDKGANVSFNVENLNSVSFTIGHIDDSETTDAALYIYIDNKEFDKIELKGDMKPIKYTLDVSSASTVRFYKDSNYNRYGLGDITISKKDTSADPPVTTPVVTSAPSQTTPPVTTVSDPAVTSAPGQTTPPVTTVSEPAVTSAPGLTTPPVTTNIIEPSSKGDINGDGKSTTSDVRIILQALVDAVKLSDTQKANADVDGDGKITSADALKLLRYVTGVTETL